MLTSFTSLWQNTWINNTKRQKCLFEFIISEISVHVTWTYYFGPVMIQNVLIQSMWKDRISDLLIARKQRESKEQGSHICSRAFSNVEAMGNVISLNIVCFALDFKLCIYKCNLSLCMDMFRFARAWAVPKRVQSPWGWKYSWLRAAINSC